MFLRSEARGIKSLFMHYAYYVAHWPVANQPGGFLVRWGLPLCCLLGCSAASPGLRRIGMRHFSEDSTLSPDFAELPISEKSDSVSGEESLIGGLGCV